jgi:type I restriction enzyme M protein
MLDHIQQKVFPWIKTLNSKEMPFARHMANAVFIIPKPSLLDNSVGIIDEIYGEISQQQDEGQGFQDSLGDMYEFLLNEIATAGKNGQFRTPRHIIQLICELVDPDLGGKICDPSSGTGGFLLGAYQHILSKYTSPEYLKTDENGFQRGQAGDLLKDERLWEQLRQSTFYGYDFDTTMVRLGLMNLMLHGIRTPRIDYLDTLSKRFDEEHGSDRYRYVLANPPFKGSIDKGDIGELRISTSKTELLFVDRIIKMLEGGGRAGVIIPDGVLFGSSKAHKATRELLLRDCRLEAVISMPSGVFKPYAGVSTGVLIFTKIEDDAKQFHTEKVWFYEMDQDGYSLDDNRKYLDMDPRPLPQVTEAYLTHVKDKTDDPDRKKKHFFVPLNDIKENDYDLSFNRYREMVYEEAVYDPPKEILAKLITNEKAILKEMEELNGMLG